MKTSQSLTFSCGISLSTGTLGQIVVGKFEHSILCTNIVISAFPNKSFGYRQGWADMRVQTRVRPTLMRVSMTFPQGSILNSQNIQISKVGSSNVASSSSGLFYLFYYRSSDGSYTNIIFSVPGISERSVRQDQGFVGRPRRGGDSTRSFLGRPAVGRSRSPGQNGMTNGKWYAIKVEQRLSGSLCVTTFHLSGAEIFNEVHTCGSYTTETTKLWAAGYRSAGDYASGSISHFRFIWL